MSALGVLLFVGPWLVNRAPGAIVLVYVPADVLANAETLNTSVQLLGPAASEPPVSVTEPGTMAVPAMLVTTPPLHCGDAGAPITVSPKGIVSVKLIPVNAPPVAGLLIVIVTVLFCPATIGLVENALATLTVVTVTGAVA